jgi:Ion channel
LWFSLCSLTSVGYGELLPSTWLGRIFASLCAVLGVIMLSLTIPVISANFSNLYAHVMSRDQASLRIRRSSSAAVEPAEIASTADEDYVSTDFGQSATVYDKSSRATVDSVKETEDATQKWMATSHPKERRILSRETHRPSIPE